MRSRLLLLSCAAALAVATPASGQVMKFDGFANPGSYVTVPNCYVENGFVMTDNVEGCGQEGGLGVWGNALSAFQGPMTSVFTNYGGMVVSFTKQGGGLFNFSSIDLYPIYGNGAGTTTVGFTGYYANNTTTVQSFTFSNQTNAYSPAVFNASFTNLARVDLDQHNGGEGPWTQFDNATFNVTSTPEPASLALLATGLVGLAGFAKRRAKGRSV